MQTQDFSALDNTDQQRDETVFSWLRAMRDELAGRGIVVGIPRQFSGDDVVVGYRQDLQSNGDKFVLECKLQDEGAMVLRASFYTAGEGALVVSYRVNLGATCNDFASALSQRLVEARARVQLIADYFDQARTRGTLMH